MIVGVYATLGVFLLWAARKPELHLSLIWFTVWSSAVHGLIMVVQAVTDSAERGHLFGDVNYGQWESKEAFEAILKQPGFNPDKPYWERLASVCN